MSEVFLLDANVFINPYQQYYRFSIAPTYWELLNRRANNESVFTIEHVKNEICRGKTEEKKDDLQKWFEDTFTGKVINVDKDELIAEGYAEIIQYLDSSDYYQPSALREWSDYREADPWLIATAKAHQYTIVTRETFAHELSLSQPAKTAKIPNVCEYFNVECIDLFTMLERLHIIL